MCLSVPQMALSPPELYHTEFVRSARAVGVLWGVCTVCLAVLQVVVLVQPAWVVTTETSSSASGTLGLFQVRQHTGSQSQRRPVHFATSHIYTYIFYACMYIYCY